MYVTVAKTYPGDTFPAAPAQKSRLKVERLSTLAGGTWMDGAYVLWICNSQV